MSDLRWSFDARTEELEVWDSENGKIQHYDKCGAEGYFNCSQGRIYLNDAIFIYGNRPTPTKDSGINAEQLKRKAKEAVIQYLEDNKLDSSLPWITIY